MIYSQENIHPSSIIEEGALIGKNVHIGPFCFIGANVEIGENTILKSHVVINGHTRIGKNNVIYQFASIGEVNQDLKYFGEMTRVEIGDLNCIREYVTIHRGTIQANGLTKLGNSNLLMVNTHIAHDCIIGDYCIFANNATLGGHVTIDDFVIVGGMTAIHQWCIIGAHAMIGGCSGVVKDIPPYVIAQGNHAVAFSINVKGLKRRGFSREVVHAIFNVYKLLYRSDRTLEEVKSQILMIAKKHAEIQVFCDFFARSKRGLID